ncbi:unnamed protein product [Penicillium salamii]|uniref:Uncharacterized protein n=1 Tax=Penicillium salamii TaxID=1612424 RepID=A0A9W4J0A9_9EURO|nr:unnamed protein product [Penicillium salamii]CAG8023897.1 unnamed protein product [Penicillium salamii]CAG8024661.1 unnamed protein product [Penicillium salamii]CAG8051106.1 unnamed protein product [Penicillium salamii]CAG8072242.1 unnamed protein product [Penicillium salamii]
MGRTVDQEVHAAFVEFRAKEDDKVRSEFRNISTPSPTYETPFWGLCILVSLRSVYLLSTNSRKEYLATETTSHRVSRLAWSP